MTAGPAFNRWGGWCNELQVQMMMMPAKNERTARREWKSKPSGYLALVFSITLACFSLPSQAGQNGPDLSDFVAPQSANSFAPAPGISVERATAIARRHTGGRVLSTTPKKVPSGMAYKVRMLVDGERVVTVLVDPKGHIKK